MDYSMNEFNNTQSNSVMNKFSHYNRSSSQCQSTKNLHNKPFFTQMKQNIRKLSRQASTTVTNINLLNLSNLDDSNSKILGDKVVSYASQELTRTSSELSLHKTVIQVLDLSNSNLSQIPLEVLNLNSLLLLKLDNNKLKQLPNQISKLNRLETLSIAHNQLTCLPPNLSALISLKNLNVEANAIEIISDEIAGLKKLKVLNIYQNQLNYLPCSIKDLNALEEFQFEWFQYTKPSINTLQKGTEGKPIITKMRNLLSALAKKKLIGINFKPFIEFFSTESISFSALDNHSRTMLHRACLNEDLSVIKFICLNIPGQKDMSDKDEMTPFSLSLLKDKFKALNFLISQGVNVTHGGGKFGSTLHIATKKLDLDNMKTIINAGSNPNQVDLVGNTPLHYAISSMTEGNEKASSIVQYLIDQNVDPNIKNLENWTPLHLIVRKGDIKSLEWVISHNFEVKEVYGGAGRIFNLDKRGGAFSWSVLHIAAYTGSFKMIEALGEAGANFFVPSVHGYIAKSMIRYKGLALKLIQKYEHNYIKKNILPKKRSKQKLFTGYEVQSPTHKRGLGIASKNRFSKKNLIPYSRTDLNLMNSPSAYIGKIKFEFPKTDSPVKIISKRGSDDSYDVLPETETGIPELLDNNKHAELELAENLFMESDRSAIQINSSSPTTPFLDKTIRRVETAKLKSGKNKFVDANFDIETYKIRLTKEQNFGMSFCKRELEYLTESLLYHAVPFTEKLKLLLALRALHTATIEHIYSKFTISVPKASLSFLILESRDCKSPGYEQIQYFRKDENPQIIQYYELVPNVIINIFGALRSNDFGNNLIKQNICKILGEINYLPGVQFLQSIRDNKQENILIVQEAKSIQSLLNSSLQRHRPVKIHHELLKMQYAKTLSPKANFYMMPKTVKKH